MTESKRETVFVVRDALHGSSLASNVCTVDIEKPTPSGNVVFDKLLAGTVRSPFGTLYDIDYHNTETVARDAIRDKIAADRERLHAALTKLDRLESELDSGAPLFTTHIELL